jgi:hypothetical protein
VIVRALPTTTIGGCDPALRDPADPGSMDVCCLCGMVRQKDTVHLCMLDVVKLLAHATS